MYFTPCSYGHRRPKRMQDSQLCKATLARVFLDFYFFFAVVVSLVHCFMLLSMLKLLAMMKSNTCVGFTVKRCSGLVRYVVVRQFGIRLGEPSMCRFKTRAIRNSRILRQQDSWLSFIAASLSHAFVVLPLLVRSVKKK